MTIEKISPIPPSSDAPRVHRRWPTRFVLISHLIPWLKSHPLQALLLSAIMVLACWAGIRLRLWLYPASEPYRFHFDINNAWKRGMAVLGDARKLQGDNEPIALRSLFKAYLNRYDAITAQSRAERYTMDYPPMRLLIMTLWVWHNEPYATAEKSILTRWILGPAPQPQELAGPLLILNTLFCLAGAVAAFLIVLHVLSRQQSTHAHWLALTSAILLWFNPAVLINAHVWPQWDVWVVPFYLWAAYLCLTRRWLAAGICLGLGIMFKGQILCTMAIFPLWALFQMRWRAAVELLAGICLGVMILAWPWMLRTGGAWVCFLMTFSLLAGLSFYIPRQWRKLLLYGAVPTCLLISGVFFGGSFDWWRVGIAYGSRQHLRLFIGMTDNLPALLAIRFRWRLLDPVFSVGGQVVTLRQLLVCMYALLLVLCAVGLARHDARNDRRTLLALGTPWALMFAFLPQMHERYLVWAAAVTALAAGVSLGTTLLHLLVTILACLPMGYVLLRKTDDSFYGLSSLCENSLPDIGWMVVLLALILLYLSLTPSSRTEHQLRPA